MGNKAVIVSETKTCGDGCCSWGELSILVYNDHNTIEFEIDDLISIQQAINICKENNWSYVIQD